jgi:hypothetical protein
MNREDIIKLAREIAIQASTIGPKRTWTYDYAMTRLMKLADAVVAVETTRTLKILHDNATKSKGMAVHALIASAQQIEARSERTKKTHSALHSDDMIQP